MVRRRDWLPVFAIGMGSVLGVVASAVLADALGDPDPRDPAAAPVAEAGARAGATVRPEGPHPTLEPSPPPRVWTAGEQGATPPIVYIDGVRQDGSDVLAALDPSAIERMEVLKDAAAIERFGAEAAGGVIQIYLRKDVEPGTRR